MNRQALRSNLVAAVFLFTFSHLEFAKASWSSESQLPRNRAEQAAVTVGGKIYVFSGLNENQRTGPAEMDRFDPASNSWDVTLSTLPRNKNHAGIVVYQDRYIILTGGKIGAPDSGVRWVDRYDTVTNTWDELPDLPVDMWGAPAAIIGSKLHTFGGAITNSASATHHYQLDLDNTGAGWISQTSLPTAVIHSAAAVFNGKIYSIGGESAHTHPANGQYDLVQVYNPSSNSWAQAAELPIARNHIENSVFVYDNKIWSVGGVDSSNNPRGQKEILTFDGSSWTEENMDLPSNFVGSSATMVNDTIYVMGGWINTWQPSNITKTNISWQLSNQTPVTVPTPPPNFEVN